MNDQIVYVDVFDEEVVLDSTVRRIILAKHPEVADFIDRVGEVLRQPDEVRRSVKDERVALYYRYEDDVLGGKWVTVVVKSVDRKFISTIYATDRIKSGERIWPK
ncbi:MAG TPA: DUF4258 domain-containing protein [Chloroflexi bacterium]|nr:DUF4258 domain-containing protein [Chloroflexota bacterium]